MAAISDELSNAAQRFEAMNRFGKAVVASNKIEAASQFEQQAVGMYNTWATVFGGVAVPVVSARLSQSGRWGKRTNPPGGPEESALFCLRENGRARAPRLPILLHA